jgi:glycine/D-amino acid oxidase-like deaminating enzyme
MTVKKAYHVVVIGGGITGLSTALHLKRGGISHVAIAQGETLGSPSRLASGFCSGGQLDNFTRISHLHGMTLANDLWTFGNNAFDSLAMYAQEHDVSYQAGRRLRLLASSSEFAESQKATEELSSLGFQSAVLLPRPIGLHERISGVQDDGPRGAFVDPEQLFHSLSTVTSNIPRIPAVNKIVGSQEAVSLILADGTITRAEVVVVAAHLHTGLLVPELGPALVPFTDQWTKFTFENQPMPEWCSPGTAFTTNHTHEWGVIVSETTIHFGGGRYLRPLAGVESSRVTVDPKITKHLKELLSQTFACIRRNELSAISSFGMVDIQPCDQLPVVGPMFGEPRLLIATGFGGQGLQTGFYAGAQVAELIAKGSAPNLPRSLWPERLRSLPENA